MKRVIGTLIPLIIASTVLLAVWVYINPYTAYNLGTTGQCAPDTTAYTLSDATFNPEIRVFGTNVTAEMPGCERVTIVFPDGHRVTLTMVGSRTDTLKQEWSRDET